MTSSDRLFKISILTQVLKDKTSSYKIRIIIFNSIVNIFLNIFFFLFLNIKISVLHMCIVIIEGWSFFRWQLLSSPFLSVCTENLNIELCCWWFPCWTWSVMRFLPGEDFPLHTVEQHLYEASRREPFELKSIGSFFNRYNSHEKIKALEFMTLLSTPKVFWQV